MVGFVAAPGACAYEYEPAVSIVSAAVTIANEHLEVVMFSSSECEQEQKQQTTCPACCSSVILTTLACVSC